MEKLKMWWQGRWSKEEPTKLPDLTVRDGLDAAAEKLLKVAQELADLDAERREVALLADEVTDVRTRVRIHSDELSTRLPAQG